MSHSQPPVTRLTLIGALRQGLRWEEFVALYGRLILLWGRRDFGLQESDAENLRQEVLIRVWRGIGGYDPAKGRFRSWLYTCTRNAVSNLRRDERGLQGAGAGAGMLEEPAAREPPLPLSWQQLPDDCDLEQALNVLEEEGFDADGLQQAVLSVRARVQANTWKAFLLFEFFEMKAKQIAPLVGMKPAAVNQAVHRVRQLLQRAAHKHDPSLRPGPESSR
jgi:RNA polymerase sigma-70 factor (ECF subfamily)